MKHRLLWLFLLFCFTQAVSHHANAAHLVLDKPYTIGLDLSLERVNQLSSTHFPLGFSVFNYQPSKQRSPSIAAGVSVGHRLFVSELDYLILGISYRQLSDIHVKGSLTQGISPPYFRANYQYSIDVSQLLFNAKWQHQWGSRLFPFINAGIGQGFAAAKGFKTNVPYYLTLTPAFSNHHSTSLSYALGLGAEVLMASNTTVTFSYVYTDWGKVGLGRGIIRTTPINAYLTQPHLYTNAILVALNRYF